MTLDEKIGQMLVSSFESISPDDPRRSAGSPVA
jgi:hypothetical protein